MNEISPLGNSQASEKIESNQQPHNIEAEQALLGALLVNNDVYDKIAAVVRDVHFYDPVLGIVLEKMKIDRAEYFIKRSQIVNDFQ